jgi:L-lactate dehydrogenase complex protein LldE
MMNPSTASPKIANLFVTCMVDAFFPEAGMATVDILEAQGYTVRFPEAQTCCGQPAFNAGFHDEARKMARHNINVLSQTEGVIILPSGSCTDMIVHHWRELFAPNDPIQAQIEQIAGRTYELTQFLVDVLGVTDVGAAGNGRVAYHPSCHGLRNLGLTYQAQTLLANVRGIELVDLPEAESCCGFGGLFAVKMSDISGAMLSRKLANVEASGADILVGGDVSCLLHMAGGLHKQGKAIQVKHIAELLRPSQKANEE